MNIEKKRKKSSKEKKFNEKKNIYNHLIKTKDSEKYLTNKFKKTSNIKTNFEPKTLQKENNNKINHINLKNIIKKIDLISLSLTKKTNKNRKKYFRKKNLEPKDKNINSHFIQLDLDKFKKEKKYEKLTFLRLNSKNSKYNSSHKKINFTWENLTEHRPSNNNKGNQEKIKLLKSLNNNLYKENFNVFDNNYMTNSKNKRITGNIKLINYSLSFPSKQKHRKN